MLIISMSKEFIFQFSKVCFSVVELLVSDQQTLKALSTRFIGKGLIPYQINRK